MHMVVSVKLYRCAQSVLEFQHRASGVAKGCDALRPFFQTKQQAQLS